MFVKMGMLIAHCAYIPIFTCMQKYAEMVDTMAVVRLANLLHLDSTP